MNILNKFIGRSLKLNKKRTIVTIIGIALSTALIVATAGLVSSFQKTLLNDAIKSYGNYHVEFKKVNQEEKENISSNKEVKKYMLTQDIGFAYLGDSQNEYKPYLYLKEYDQMALENLGINIINGRLPQNNNEIIISEHIISNGEVDYKIGDKINLNIGERVVDSTGEVLDNNVSLFDEPEHIEEQLKKEYTIVGIMERPSYNQEGYSAPGYTIISKLEKENTNVNMYVIYKNVLDTYKVTEEINEADEYIIEYNSNVLRYSGLAKSDSMNSMLYTVAGIVIAIIVFSSVFVIRNSFSISVTEKYKQYGMLASIGATPKQIKKNVLYEGFILGIIAIPLGIVMAAVAVFILCWLINFIIGDYLNNIEFTFSMPIWAILVGVIMAIVTIYLSCIIPAKKASKISPIDAIRSNQDIKVSKKKLKISPLFKRLFNIGGQISLKNLKRNKKKYRTTVISLVVSIVIFISLSSILQYGFNMGNAYYEQLPYNLVVSADEEQYKEILKLDDIKNYSYWEQDIIEISVDKYLSNDLKDRYGETEAVSIAVVLLNSSIYNEYIKKIGVDLKGNEGILIDDYNFYDGEKTKLINYLSVNEGDTVNDIKIVKRTTERPMGLEYENAIIVVSNEYKLEEAYTSPLYINSKNPDKLEEDINNLLEDIHITNYNEYVKENKAVMLIISIFLYGFITVITLIGVTNIFNTITTNMALRSKEFAMLKSIGMTNAEFNKMIRLESILYGTKSLIIGIPIGLILSYIIYKTIVTAHEMTYSFPFVPIIIAIVFVFIIVTLTMRYSLNKINNQNIIETIRNDNI